MAPKVKDAIAMLKAEHRKVEELFEEFDAASSRAKQKTIVLQICTELMIHTMIEEEIFYPAVKGKIDSSTLDEAYVEHDGAKLLISQIMAGKPGDAFFEAKLMVLAEEIKHHVKEEEEPKEGMFAQASDADVDLVGLGKQMAARRAELETEFKSDGLPAPTARTLSEIKIELGEPVG